MQTENARASKMGAVFRVTSGNFLEMFDFFLFGLYASNISSTFFPSVDKTASLMAAFATFGAGFLMRPLGAIILGAYVDRIGRRRGLITTLGIMACGTVLIAFVPGYASIGVAAPILVLIGRLLQGFSAGVELGGVSVYLSEMATPGHKGFYVSWQSASQQVAIIVAAALGYTVNRWMEPSLLAEVGWRIPFFIGCLIIPFIFVIRRSLQETEEFLARKHRPGIREIFRSMVDNAGIVVAGMMLVLMTTVSFYLITIYTPTFGKDVLKLSTTDSLVVTLCVGLSNFFWLPIMGALSDRIGRKPLLIAFTVIAILTVYPVLWWLVVGADLRQNVGSRAVVIFSIRQLQWRHGGGVDRGHAGQRAHGRLLARLQPGHHHRRIYAIYRHLVDKIYRRQGGSRLVDDLRGIVRLDCHFDAVSA